MTGHVCHDCKKKRPTFAAAREALLAHLKTEGWDVHVTDKYGRPLKTPYAMWHNGFRLWFKPQAVHKGFTSNLNDARSTHDDIRDFTPAEFLSRNVG